MNAIQAFPDAELAKLVCPTEDKLIDWTIRGTKLVATVQHDGLPHEVEVETTYAADAIESWEVNISWFETPPLQRGGREITSDGRLVRRRYLSEKENPGLFAALHEAAGEFLEDHSYSVCIAWDRELEEERAEGAMVEEAGMR